MRKKTPYLIYIYSFFFVLFILYFLNNFGFLFKKIIAYSFKVDEKIEQSLNLVENSINLGSNIVNDLNNQLKSIQNELENANLFCTILYVLLTLSFISMVLLLYFYSNAVNKFEKSYKDLNVNIDSMSDQINKEIIIETNDKVEEYKNILISQTNNLIKDLDEKNEIFSNKLEIHLKNMTQPLNDSLQLLEEFNKINKDISQPLVDAYNSFFKEAVLLGEDINQIANLNPYVSMFSTFLLAIATKLSTIHNIMIEDANSFKNYTTTLNTDNKLMLDLINNFVLNFEKQLSEVVQFTSITMDDSLFINNLTKKKGKNILEIFANNENKIQIEFFNTLFDFFINQDNIEYYLNWLQNHVSENNATLNKRSIETISERLNEYYSKYQPNSLSQSDDLPYFQHKITNKNNH